MVKCFMGSYLIANVGHICVYAAGCSQKIKINVADFSTTTTTARKKSIIVCVLLSDVHRSLMMVVVICSATYVRHVRMQDPS